MFIDELEITARAGDGGPGVVRWRHEKGMPMGGPSGGDGGRGGNVYVRAVRDLSLLARYTGSKEFLAEHGQAGQKRSMHGYDGKDLYIDVPVGATVTERERGRVYQCEHEGQTHKILQGGRGGLGNEHFKSATNQAPEQSTRGTAGERGTFLIELSLLVDVGLVGLPNAGKSTLINAITNTNVRVGAYPFTTLEPSLGEFYGFIIADIPGLIEGASEGKGLGHKFLRHVSRTKMLLHCVSLEHSEVADNYQTIRTELERFDQALLAKDEWVILTKSDLVTAEEADSAVARIAAPERKIFVISAETGEGIKALSDALSQYLTQKTA